MAAQLLKKLAANQTLKASLLLFAALLVIYLIPPITHRSQNPIYQRSGLSALLSPGLANGQSTIDPNDGFTSQALGHQAAESWLRGDVPYWDHNEGVGSPLAGEMQAAALSPFVLLLHFSAGLVYMHFLLQLLAGVATYLFLRKLKIGFAVAVLGGGLFMFSGAFAWLTNAAFNPVAFLPLLLLGIECAISSVGSRRKGGWGLIAVALSLSLYAGFPEGAFINALFAYGWAAVRLLQISSRDRLVYMRKVVFGSIVGILLAAPILVAFVDYLPYALTGGHGNGGYANVHLASSALPALFMPYIFGPIFDFVSAGKPQDLFLFWSNVGGYITMPLFAAGIIGLFAKRPASQKVYLGIFALVVALKIYGFKPVSVIVNAIPGMDQVAFYRYSVPVLCMSLLILAMFGVDAAVKSEVRKKTVAITAGLVALWTLLMALVSRHVLHQLQAFPQHKHWALVSVVWALVSVLLIAASMFVKSRKRLAVLALVLGIDVVVMFIIPFMSLPKTGPVDQAPVTYLQKNLGLGRFYTLHPIQPNYGSYYNIASINVNDLPVPKKWTDYIPKKLDGNAVPILFTGYSRADAAGPTALDEFARNISNYEEIGVSFLVTDKGSVSSNYSQQVGLKKVFSDNQVEIYRLSNPVPYFTSKPSCHITPEGRDNVQTICDQSSTLTRRELFMKGWTAKVNGKQQPIHLTGDIFQSVSLPQGASTVHFNFTPPYMYLGYASFASGIVLIVGGIVWRGRSTAAPAPKTKTKKSQPRVKRLK